MNTKEHKPSNDGVGETGLPELPSAPLLDATLGRLFTAHDMRAYALAALASDTGERGVVAFCKVEDVFDNDSVLAQMGVKRGAKLYTHPPAQASGAVTELVPSELEVSHWPDVREGMHVGLVPGVKVTHTPTGTTVICSAERSQHKNRERALRGLTAALAQGAGK